MWNKVEVIMSMMIKLIQCLNDALYRKRFQSVSILFSSHLTIEKKNALKEVTEFESNSIV